MNKHNNSLGKRSTNTASLSNAISSIKTSISPIIKTGSTNNNPKPMKSGKELWLRRKVRLFCSQATSATETSLQLTAIFSTAGVSGQIRVLGMKVWNYTGSNYNSNYLKVVVPARLTETAVSTAVEDIGNSSHLPGVSVVIPRTLASNLTNVASQFVVISGAANSAVPSFTQNYVVDVDFEYKTENID